MIKMINEIIELSVDKLIVDKFLDEYINKNDIQLKNDDVCINGEAMGKAGFAALMRFCYVMLVSEDDNKRKFAIDILENIKLDNSINEEIYQKEQPGQSIPAGISGWGISFPGRSCKTL
jgi:hypothetical protein